jgi:hypothetical protein
MKNTMPETIYENTRMNFPLTKIIEATITEEIDNILKQQKPAVSSQDLEELRNLLFEVSDISEKQGFVLGFRYAVALLHES